MHLARVCVMVQEYNWPDNRLHPRDFRRRTIRRHPEFRPRIGEACNWYGMVTARWSK